MESSISKFLNRRPARELPPMKGPHPLPTSFWAPAGQDGGTTFTIRSLGRTVRPTIISSARKLRVWRPRQAEVPRIGSPEMHFSGDLDQHHGPVWKPRIGSPEMHFSGDLVHVESAPVPE